MLRFIAQLKLQFNEAQVCFYYDDNLFKTEEIKGFKFCGFVPLNPDTESILNLILIYMDGDFQCQESSLFLY